MFSAKPKIKPFDYEFELKKARARIHGQIDAMYEKAKFYLNQGYTAKQIIEKFKEK